MQPVREVEIRFENCETVTIPIRWFRSLIIKDVEMCIQKATENSFSKIMYANYFKFKLDRGLDSVASDLKGLMHIAQENMCSWRLLNRIYEMQNIMSFTLHYVDNTSEKFILPWESRKKHYDRNRLQNARFTRKGNLCVKICKLKAT